MKLDSAPFAYDPATYWPGLSAATAGLDTPFGAVSVPALAHNAHDMLRRSAGTTIRVASKSIRVRGVIESVLALPGYQGVLAYTLPEALWLAETVDDVVVGYPSVDRAAIERLGSSEKLASRVTLMVDSTAQLDVVDAVLGAKRETIRVALELNASWRSPLLGYLGVYRSPVQGVEDARALAREIAARPGFRLVGIMAYEAQIAGQPDDTGSGDAVIRWMQRRSTEELRERRGAIVGAVRDVADLEFVNGGGTGSLEYTASDPAVTETTAGSGLLAGHLFDLYRHFTLAPAAAFALEVVRRPADDIVTVLGGGWIASGPPVASRQPLPAWPTGLATLAREGAGEVQTPLQGAAAKSLSLGDRVWFRHAKSGELAERVDRYHLTSGDTIVGEAATYRGEGKSFL